MSDEKLDREMAEDARLRAAFAPVEVPAELVRALAEIPLRHPRPSTRWWMPARPAGVAWAGSLGALGAAALVGLWLGIAPGQQQEDDAALLTLLDGSLADVGELM